ncbi:MAG: uracil-DNA glycosylase family protein [Odoribacter sp.]|nr:uracil-DNA glycosylase family protein [Odoribacter sp.]
MEEFIEIEEHPWEPFIPQDARVLIMGTFPPQSKRWSMDFYYPNRTNDFWPVMGLIFYGNRDALLLPSRKGFDLDKIKDMLSERGIALNDTGRKIRRLRGNASDKYLQIIEPVPLYDLLDRMPLCHCVATTGEKAAGVVAEITSTPVPSMGEKVVANVGLEIWRMPSTSRAYPLALEKKAEIYERMFVELGIKQRT